jgi:hypothetical protein
MKMGGIFPKMTSLAGLGASIVAYQQWKEMNPLARENLMDSAKTVIKGMTYATVLGLGASLFGPGRFRGAGPAWRSDPTGKPARFGHDFATNMPELAEGVNTVMRGGPQSFWAQQLADEKSSSPVMGRVMENLQHNMNLFHPQELDQIGKAASAGKLRPTLIDMLTKNPDFAQRMGFQ